MKTCKAVHIRTNENKVEEIRNEIRELKEKLNELEEKLNKIENQEIKKTYSKEELSKMSNEEIQELLNNHICYIEYIKRNREWRIFENFTFKKDYRKEGTGNFNYEKELQNFVFGIELDTEEFKRLKPNSIQYIEILS